MVTVLLPSDIIRIQQEVENHRGEGQIELEFRFGSYRGNRFEPGVSFNDFNTLENVFSKYPASVSHTKDWYEPGGRRRTAVLDDNNDIIEQFITTKSRPSRIDYPDYGFRVAVSRETNQDNDPTLPFETLFRDKRRSSYTIQNKLRVDMTIVTSIDPQFSTAGKTQYEVEIEILDPTNWDSIFLIRFLTTIVQTIQGTKVLYTLNEKYETVRDFNTILGSTRRLPEGILDNRLIFQARNIKYKDLVDGGIVPSGNGVSYTVTLKAKGDRKFLFLRRTGLYFVAPPSQVSKILKAEQVAAISSHFGTILEGELISPSQLRVDLPEIERRELVDKIYYLIYDCLSSGGNGKVRDNDHHVRLSYAESLLKAVRNVTQFRFEIKHFLPFTVPEQFFARVNQCLDQTVPFETDGLIFTPLNSKYDSSVQRLPLRQRNIRDRPEILKWKDWADLTIDFRIKRVATSGGVDIKLYMNNPNGDETEFIGSRFWPFTSSHLLSNQVLESVPNGSILEFEPIRDPDGTIRIQANKLRKDKDKPNNIEIAQDIWNDIHNPIDSEIIRGRKFGLVFRYHNREKAKIYSYLKQAGCRTLLSIGAGNGGDIGKWLEMGITHAICVEPNDENRAELHRRIQTAPGIRFTILPVGGQDIQTIGQAVRAIAPNGVDFIEYMLSLSFFFGNTTDLSTVIQNAYYNVRPGGYFVAFTVEATPVIQYFNQESNRTISKTPDNGYLLQSKFTQIDFQLRVSANGQKTVGIDIPDSIVRDQSEYLVEMPLLTQYLAQSGFRLISEAEATSETMLNPEELVFTRFYKSYIYRRE